MGRVVRASESSSAWGRQEPGPLHEVRHEPLNGIVQLVRVDRVTSGHWIQTRHLDVWGCRLWWVWIQPEAFSDEATGQKYEAQWLRWWFRWWCVCDSDEGVCTFWNGKPWSWRNGDWIEHYALE